MDRKDALYYDEMLWLMIYDSTNHRAMCSLQTMSDEMVKKGFVDSSKQKVDRALERLIQRGKIQRYTDGKYYITEALIQVSVYDDFNSFFVDEKPIIANDLVLRLCNYMRDNRYIGRAHRIPMDKLAKWFDIDDRQLRRIVERLNFDGYILPDKFDWDYIIVGDIGLGGYFIAETMKEGLYYLKKYENTIYKASRKSRILRKKLGLHNQMSSKYQLLEIEIKNEHEDDMKRVQTFGDQLLKTALPSETKNEKEVYLDDDGNPLPF